MPWAPRRPRRYTGVRGLIVSLARLNYRIVAPVVRTFPSVVFFGTVLLVILAVWAHALLFQFVDDCVNECRGVSVFEWNGVEVAIAAFCFAIGGVDIQRQFLDWGLEFRLGIACVGSACGFHTSHLNPKGLWYEGCLAVRWSSGAGTGVLVGLICRLNRQLILHLIHLM